MNKIITVGCTVIAAAMAVAMPNKDELTKAKPIVEAATGVELAAYKAGEKTAQKVALAHLVLAQKTESEAEKYLLCQGAFKLYVRSGEYDLAADAIQIMKRDVKNVPLEVIAEIVGDELRYVSDDKALRLVAMLNEAKRTMGIAKTPSKATKDRSTIQSIIDGMIKVPGKDYWLSETELTQGQWEAVMGYNLSANKGVDLPVENVSRDDCDVFLEKLNQTKEAQASRLEFRLPGRVEWANAARTGLAKNIFIKPNIVVSNLLDIAWVKENSNGQTHAVAMKEPNAWGFYDMVGNVHEWVVEGPEPEERGTRRGYSFRENLDQCRLGRFFFSSRNSRFDSCGLRVAAHIRSNNASTSARSQLRGSLLARRKDMEDTTHLQATVDGCTWSYRVDNGEATIEAKKDGKFVCAVSPNPTGDVVVPSMLNGVKVTGIGQEAFCHYCGPKSVKIPEGVKSLGWCAFFHCTNLTAVTLPKSLRNIGHGAFADCRGLTSVTIPEGVTNIEADAFRFCRGLKSVNIPSGVKRVNECTFDLCDKLTSIVIPNGVESIGRAAFYNCRGLKSVMIPRSVKTIGDDAFHRCSGLCDVTIPTGVTDIGGAAFGACGINAVDIPSSVVSVGEINPFSECENLMSIFVDPKSPSYSSRNDMLCSKDGIRLIAGIGGNVTIPVGVKRIERDAFKDHSRLVSVSIPESVTYIGRGAFCGCNRLKSVSIPSGVNTMASGVFLNCGELASVTFCGERPSAPDTVIVDCPKLKEIHVPANAKSWAGMKEWQGKPLVFDAKAE